MKKIQHVLLIFCLLTIAQTNTTLAQTWTGNVSTAWGTAGNWTGGIPNGSNAVTIPNTTNKPVFSTGTYTQSNINSNITIESGASLTITGGTFGTNSGSSFQYGSTLLIQSGATLTIDGGTFNNAGSIRNNGIINHISGNYNNTGHYFAENSALNQFNSTTFVNSASGYVGNYLGASFPCMNFGAGFTNNGTIAFVLKNSTTACTGFNQIVVTGTAMLANSTYEVFNDDNDVESGTTFILITATSIGSFVNADPVLIGSFPTKYVHIRQSGNTITGLVNTSPTLFVELLDFDANTEGGKNHLTWRTASEKDNSHFDIERSTDGNSFHNIGQVKGNNKPSSYQYVDASPFTMSYYRLKQVDYDGTTTYSKVISVEQKGKGKGLKVYPTLVSNSILTVDTEGGDYTIYNIVGQQVQTGKTTQRLDVSALAKGTYILKVGTEQAKFVKQ